MAEGRLEGVARRLDYDERRAQILSAARQLFSARPYSAVSTSDIAEAAGVTRGLVHHYFGAKRSLYLEVVRHLMTAAAVPMAALDGEGGGSQQAWESGVDAWMDLIEANRDMWLVAIGAGETGRDRELHAILDQAREQTATQVLRVLGLHDDDRPELRALVRGFGGLAEETTREWLERGRLTRAQARALLLGALPLMVRELLPAMGVPVAPGTR